MVDDADVNERYRRVITASQNVEHQLARGEPSPAALGSLGALTDAAHQLFQSRQPPKGGENVDELPLADRVGGALRSETAASAYASAVLVADPTLEAKRCRLPEAVAAGLLHATASGILERTGIVTTQMSATRELAALTPHALDALRRAARVAPALLIADERIVARDVELWDRPAIAVDPATAELLNAEQVTVLIPRSQEAIAQCRALADLPQAHDVASSGWLTTLMLGAPLASTVSNAALTEASDPVTDPVLALDLARWPEPEPATDETSFHHDEILGPAAPIDDAVDPEAWSLDELEISARAADVLQDAELYFTGDVCRLTRAELLSAVGGREAITAEVVDALAAIGLSLTDEP
ncbi:MAG: hypothetical protein AAF721_22525 [Myxococcota bacterium]